MRKLDKNERLRAADDDGYTITEMLIVIIVIGLVAAAVTPSLTGQLSRARVRAAELQIETVSAALEAFRQDAGRYPLCSEGLDALIKAPADGVRWMGPYVRNEKTLKDPWGRSFEFKCDASGAFVEIATLGADGKPGGKGVDADFRHSTAQQ
jgi:general secretion pathway protein G